MNMNLLKGEKAFLMADVRIQTKGKWGKIWTYVYILIMNNMHNLLNLIY